MKIKKGFTLVELLVVIVLVGLLVAIAVPAGLTVSKKVKQKMLENKIELIESGAIAYGQSNKSLLDHSCTIDGTTYNRCYSASIKNLLKENVFKEDDIIDDEKVLTNPVINDQLNYCKVYIYIKNKRVYAKYDINGNGCYNIPTDQEERKTEILLDQTEDLLDQTEDFFKTVPESTETQIYIINDNKGYILKSDGARESVEGFNVECDYCVIKYSKDEGLEILSETENQDVRKDYNNSDIYSEKNNISRVNKSLYNELKLFVDWYLLNHEITEKERFVAEGKNIYKLSDDGTKNTIFKLNNSQSVNKSNIYIDSSGDFSIKILNEEKNYYINDEDGKIKEIENINNSFEKDILYLLDELVFVAEKFIANNTITDDVYFEFNDGSINIVDEYGNYIINETVIRNKNLSGSGEVLINKNKQYSFTIYEDTYDIKNNYGELKLYKQDLKYSRDMVMLVKNLDRLEKLALKYAGTASSSTYLNFYKKTWLVPFYIRRLKYNSSNYNTITGNDSNFVTYVANNASNLKTYFTNKNTFNVNGVTIDLKHMMASLAGNIYNTDAWYNLVYEELEYDCLVSWAGDLQEFMEYNILKSNIKTQYGSFGEATYKLLGNSSTRFSLDDMYSDVDNWNIYYNLKSNKNLTIAELFDQYYSGISTRNYKNRFKSFIKIMNSVGSSLGKTNFSGLVNHFTNMDKDWDTVGTLSVMPTEDEEKQIATNFINWIQERANKEK